MAFISPDQLDALFPDVLRWIRSLEEDAKKFGRTLAPLQISLAQTVGIAHPEKVRIWWVPKIPLPPDPHIVQLAEQIGVLNFNTRGLTAIYSVIVRLDCANQPRLLAHEFAHVEQYERLGVEGFLREYLRQLNEYGYQNSPFELEAEAKAIKALEAFRDAR